MREIRELEELLFNANLTGSRVAMSQLELQAISQKDETSIFGGANEAYNEQELADLAYTEADRIIDEDELRTAGEQDYYYDLFVDKLMAVDNLGGLAKISTELYALPVYSTSREQKDQLWALYNARKGELMTEAENLVKELMTAVESTKEYKDTAQLRQRIWDAQLTREQKEPVWAAYKAKKETLWQAYAPIAEAKKNSFIEFSSRLEHCETKAGLAELRDELLKEGKQKFTSSGLSELWDAYREKKAELAA